ncbi:MAG: dUTP diphosphatase [Candidatus Woesearchaeota archaeon]
MKIKFKKLTENAIIPRYAHPGDAGMDLFSKENKTLKPGERYLFKLGIAMELEPGYAFIIKDKSSIPFKYGVTTLGGVVDAGYRGDIGVIMLNTSNQEVTFEKGQKIAQAIILKIETPQIEEVQEISQTSRGQGGFGSTGK